MVHGRRAALALAAVTWLVGSAAGQGVVFGPSLGVYGGFPSEGNTSPPFIFTWGGRINIYGSGWRPNEAVNIHLYGPLNSLGATPTDRILGTLHTDSNGIISGDVGEYVTIPYDNGVAGYLGDGLPDIPEPGLYRVQGIGSSLFLADQASAPDPINLWPETIPIGPYASATGQLNWPRSRGARDGWLGDNSAERTDPEWVSVWSKQPVALYATVAPTNSDGNNQPAFISHADWPATHYGHDVNLELVPDLDYRWVLSPANYQGTPGQANYGTIEFEWEFQNDGSPYTYGKGDIGMPAWVIPTAGDRVYVVGRWPLDNGHPDTGDRTEIHPARMIATMRKRNTAVPFGGEACMTRASQVDVFVSGHGGGCNRYYDGLEDLLDVSGRGGGRIEDYMPGYPAVAQDSAENHTYYAYGPSDLTAINTLVNLFGISSSGPVEQYAGPSAIATDIDTGLPSVWDHSMPVPPNLQPWTLGPEQRPVNDMNYDFDVPLPPAPAGATTPEVMVTTHPQHTTAVNEVITYTHPDPTTGLPTTAHIHLPYLGADNGEYARTLFFYWDKYSPPGSHFVVTIDDVTPVGITTSSGDIVATPLFWNLWADVCGQWTYLSGLNLAGFSYPNLKWGVPVTGLNGATFDVYLDNADSMRVFTLGYEPKDMDSLFGVDVGKPAYDAGVDAAEALYLGSGENEDVGGALYDVPIQTGVIGGQHKVYAAAVDYNLVTAGSPKVHWSMYNIDFTATYVPRPRHLEIDNHATDLGSVCLGSTVGGEIDIINEGEEPLHITSISASGGGYSVPIVGPQPPFTLAGLAVYKLTVRFTPTDVNQGAGAITVTSDDPCQPTQTVPLSAAVVHPTLSAAPLETDFPPTVVGCSTSRTVTIKNTGACELITQPSVTGDGYTLSPFIGQRDGLHIAPGNSAALTVDFAPATVAHALPGTLTLTSNDPLNPTTVVTFCGEGVENGIRVLVLQSDGTPCPSVDQITLTSYGVPHSAVNLRNVPLTSLGPPASCLPILYHADIPLPPTSTSGQNGSTYELRVRVKNKM